MLTWQSGRWPAFILRISLLKTGHPMIPVSLLLKSHTRVWYKIEKTALGLPHLYWWLLCNLISPVIYHPAGIWIIERIGLFNSQSYHKYLCGSLLCSVNQTFQCLSFECHVFDLGKPFWATLCWTWKEIWLKYSKKIFLCLYGLPVKKFVVEMLFAGFNMLVNVLCRDRGAIKDFTEW